MTFELRSESTNKPLITYEELSKHTSPEDCWIAIKGRVLDITAYLSQHPGGKNTLIRNAGTDATEEFDNKDGEGHSNSAFSYSEKFWIGNLDYKSPKVTPKMHIELHSKIYTQKEVSLHNKENDCWVIYEKKVYDVTKFLPQHPGGPKLITTLAGGDITNSFNQKGHSEVAKRMMVRYRVGCIDLTCDSIVEEKNISNLRESNNIILEPKNSFQKETDEILFKLLTAKFYHEGQELHEILESIEKQKLDMLTLDDLISFCKKWSYKKGDKYKVSVWIPDYRFLKRNIIDIVLGSAYFPWELEVNEPVTMLWANSKKIRIQLSYACSCKNPQAYGYICALADASGISNDHPFKLWINENRNRWTYEKHYSKIDLNFGDILSNLSVNLFPPDIIRDLQEKEKISHFNDLFLILKELSA